MPRSLYILACLLLVFVALAPCQTTPPNEYFGIGAGFSNASSVQGKWTGQGFYERQISADPDLFSYTEYDALAQNRKPFAVQTSMRTGIDYRCFQVQIGARKIYSFVGVDAGAGSTGQNVDLSFSGRGLVLIPFNAKLGFYIGVNGLKNSATDPAVLWKAGFLYFR